MAVLAVALAAGAVRPNHARRVPNIERVSMSIERRIRIGPTLQRYL
jgi:hypothetical protein